MLPKLPLIIAALSLVFPLSRCSSLTSPEGLAGTYVLQEIEPDLPIRR